MNIILNEADHTYHDADTGRIIPDSCTGLLTKLGFREEMPFYTEYGRNRGSLAHEVARMHLQGTLDESSVDPVLEPYYHSVLSFLVDTGFVVTRSEFIVYSERWDYACKVDFEGYFSVCVSAIYTGDFKTGKMQDWTRYQLALENIAMKRRGRRMGVELRANGTYRVKHYEDKWDEQEVLYRLKNYKERTHE